MAETKQIGEIATRVSDELLLKFGWERTSGAEDVNFPCSRKERHQRVKTHTHPTDCVFRYLDPYSDQPQYFQTDLKSYSTKTLQSTNIGSVIRSLACSVECAQTDDTWRERYGDESDSDFTVHGLLFIYNHDNEFDAKKCKSFKEKLRTVLPGSLALPKDSRLYVIGPEEILFLQAMENDFNRVIVDNRLVGSEPIRALHLDQQTRFAPKRGSRTSSIEDLLSPFLFFQFLRDANDDSEKTIVIYYRGAGESPEEFEFMFDYLFRRNLVGVKTEIQIRAPFLCEQAEQNFEKAKDRILLRVYNLAQFGARLECISLERIKTVSQNFSTVKIGMERRK